MARQKMVGGILVALTPDEETARDAEEQAWADGQPVREMVAIRKHRDIQRSN